MIDAEKEDMSSNTEKKGAVETPAHGAGNVDNVEKTQENSDAEVLTSKEDPPSIDPIVASPESNSENDAPAEALEQENSTEENSNKWDFITSTEFWRSPCLPPTLR